MTVADPIDRRVVERLLTRIRPFVVRYCRAKLSTSPDDVAREVCLAVLTALPGIREKRTPLLAFVYGIAAATVASARGKPAEPAFLRGLPVGQREILLLRVAVGLSTEETAHAVGSTPNAVRVAQHRALAALRAHP
ncbi:sigma factor-like helix-turn-helix DNA-binding protein [Actinosynnema sp. NPDC020468]|uniref:sigma factor-like helix-turn-helix DNA-binding protein n=1 Tax=Actinosynnema sp. NPDC020468 TaxID=3154488 RepID=UPI0033E068D6